MIDAVLRVNGETPEGSTLDEDGYVTVEFDWEAPSDRWRCSRCDAVFADEYDAEGEECSEDGEDGDGPHHLVRENKPLGWVNSAYIHTDEEADTVSVGVSVGDPRGAFVMRLHRMEDGTVRMEVPYPGQGWFLHAPLTEIGSGHYQVG